MRYGLNRRYVDRDALSTGFDLASLGFASNVVQVAQDAEFPRIDVQGFQSLGQTTFTDLVIAPTTHQFNFNGTKILSSHTVKFGMDYRKFLLNFTQLFFPAGQYGFNNAQWTQRDPERHQLDAGIRPGIDAARHPELRPNQPQSGSGIGQFVLGVLHSGRLEDLPSNLTLNIGLRYEFDVPRTERFDRLSYFDANAPSPIANLVPANPFFNPRAPQGALVFMDENNRRQVDTDLNNFGPRIGACIQRLAEDRHPLRVRRLSTCPRTCRRPGTRDPPA